MCSWYEVSYEPKSQKSNSGAPKHKSYSHTGLLDLHGYFFHYFNLQMNTVFEISLMF